ncbi:MAG: patatin-like phospholipase family protein [Acidobacteriota bacterium]
MISLDRGVVVALGGGGMRGVAHLGVLAELSAAGVEIRALAGTSSGALMGALWLAAGSTGAIERVREFCRSDRARKRPDPLAMASGPGLRGKVRRALALTAMVPMLIHRHQMTTAEMIDGVGFFLPDIELSKLGRPLTVVATDASTGDEVRLREGSLRHAVAASSAMPGLVAPLAVGGRRLQDGGAVAEIPVAAARELGGPVVAVEVSEALPAGDPDRDRLPRAMFRAAAMGWRALRQRTLAEADAIIAPRVNHVHWADYGRIEEVIAAGREAGRRFLEAV